MFRGKKVVVVMPAYNAELTLLRTYHELPDDIVDEVILVDDASSDNTVYLAKQLGIRYVIRHEANKGYGANQKTCYAKALAIGADIVVMVHPDYQYTPKLVTAMAALIADGLFDCVLGSRILGTGALRGGMPRYKYVSNRFLTLFQNLLLGYKLSEYHTGFRAFSRKLLLSVPFDKNDDGFIFDNQMLAQIIFGQFDIGEITCPTRYMADSSSISFQQAVVYGFGVIQTSVFFCLHRLKLYRCKIFQSNGKKEEVKCPHLH